MQGSEFALQAGALARLSYPQLSCCAMRFLMAAEIAGMLRQPISPQKRSHGIC